MLLENSIGVHEEETYVDDVSLLKDEEIVESAQNGNREIFGELFRRYMPRLVGAMSKRTSDYHAAEDIVQDAFRLAFERIHSFGGRSQFYTWIYRIAMNQAVTRYRGRSSSETLIDRELLQTLHESYDPSCILPSEWLISREETGFVRGIVEKLTKEHCEILMLRFYESMNYVLIAETLGIELGTVRSRLHRAKSAFRHRILEIAVADALGCRIE